jgi:hypothetical protein
MAARLAAVRRKGGATGNIVTEASLRRRSMKPSATHAGQVQHLLATGRTRKTRTILKDGIKKMKTCLSGALLPLSQNVSRGAGGWSIRHVSQHVVSPAPFMLLCPLCATRVHSQVRGEVAVNLPRQAASIEPARRARFRQAELHAAKIDPLRTVREIENGASGERRVNAINQAPISNKHGSMKIGREGPRSASKRRIEATTTERL